MRKPYTNERTDWSYGVHPDSGPRIVDPKRPRCRHGFGLSWWQLGHDNVRGSTRVCTRCGLKQVVKISECELNPYWCNAGYVKNIEEYIDKREKENLEAAPKWYRFLHRYSIPILGLINAYFLGNVQGALLWCLACMLWLVFMRKNKTTQGRDQTSKTKDPPVDPSLVRNIYPTGYTPAIQKTSFSDGRRSG